MIVSHDVLAFVEVARRKSFQEAAKVLHVTQSAISQRIASLEKRLDARLFVRDHASVALTAEGQGLLRFAIAAVALEDEALGSLLASRKQALPSAHFGTLRIGAFSSVGRSVVLPALAPFLGANPGVRCDLRIREIRELERLLAIGEVDLVVTSRPLLHKGAQAISLGEEVNVLVRRITGEVASAYLDHDEFDEVTETFLRLQKPGKVASLRRHFVDDIEGVVEGARLGLGSAVIPRHLLARIPELAEIRDLVPLIVPVFLCWIANPEPPRLVRAACEELVKTTGTLFSGTVSPRPARRGRDGT